MATDFTNEELIPPDISWMSSFDYKSQTATDFDAVEAKILSCAASDKMGELWADVI